MLDRIVILEKSAVPHKTVVSGKSYSPNKTQQIANFISMVTLALVISSVSAVLMISAIEKSIGSIHDSRIVVTHLNFSKNDIYKRL